MTTFDYSLDTTVLPEGVNELGIAIIGSDGSRTTQQIGKVAIDNIPSEPVSDAVWVSDLEAPWPGRNVTGLDSWNPAEGSSIDTQRNNSNYNFHITPNPFIPA